ncbi:leucine-rich repeat extensin-like protein 2 [Neltuma alba]|uniref:leucine-rich repeat extensin-like protein 2 n=1 Tax=Neltuma alba TaxID=207710 RepID=UPI0010A35291|nr:leucine-rich repeat extensin-like protein 2 [Prosopis alba]
MALNFIFLLILCLTVPLQVVYSSRKLDETTVPAGDRKCSPCGDYSSPPPPPPALPPPSPPPPSPKKSPSQYCPPPPPPPSFIYITGPPSNLYPVDENFNSASRRSFLPAAAVLPGLVTLLLGFW